MPKTNPPLDQTPTNLTGKLLIAMPSMQDPRFQRSVILICSHSGEGAMGLVINKPAVDIGFDALLDQLGIDAASDATLPDTYFGGPVESSRGFVLHTDDYNSGETTLSVDGGYCMTATIDIIEDIARGEGPETCILALGYSGWAGGQLEEELTRDGWLVCDATPELVFNTTDDGKWTKALAQLGVDPFSLSSSTGRA